MKKLIFIFGLFLGCIVNAQNDVIFIDGAEGASGGGISGDGYGNDNSTTITASPIDDTKKILISGLSFTLTTPQVVGGSYTVWHKTTYKWTTLTPTGGHASGDTIILTGITDFTSNDSIVVQIPGIRPEHDPTLDAKKVVVLNIETYTDELTLIDETNETIDTTFYVVYMEGYDRILFDMVATGDVDFDMFGTLNCDLATDDTASYDPINTEMFGADGVTNPQAMYPISTTQFNPFMPCMILVRVICTDDTNAIKVIYRKWKQ